MLEHRTGNANVVVLREATHDPRWRVADGSKPDGQLYPSFFLNFCSELIEDLIENLDMFLGECVRSIDK